MRLHLPILSLLCAIGVARADSRGTAEFTGLYVPAFGNTFKGLSGYAVSGCLGTEYELADSQYDEFAVAQIEGLFLHGSGENDIGGPMHREQLDAGFGFFNLGIGMRGKQWNFAVIAGAGWGGGDLRANTTRDDTALNAAFQIKPRVTYRMNRDWTMFVEYRHLATSSVFGEFFNGDDRVLRLHAVGLGVSRRF